MLAHGNRHESYAEFSSDDPYEIEADYFAASLLMPEALFAPAISRAGQGIAAVEYLTGLCATSLTATAIRYANADPERVARAECTSGVSELQDWIGGRHRVEMDEDVVGLGGYGRTLTVLTSRGAVDVEELQEEEELVESWRPRFRR